MKIFLNITIAGKCFIIGLFLFSASVNAQQSEYRITEAGKYQYLNDPEQAGVIYDESNGSYYKPITIRTFFLEAQRGGYIAADVTYAEFVKLPIVLQIAAVNQPLAQVIDCATHPDSPECFKFKNLVVVVPETDTVLIVPIIEIGRLPLTQLERAKIFLRVE